MSFCLCVLLGRCARETPIPTYLCKAVTRRMQRRPQTRVPGRHSEVGANLLVSICLALVWGIRESE